MNFKMYLKTVLMTAVAVIGLSACDDNDDEQPVAPPSSEETLTFKVSVEPGVEGSVTTVSIRPTTDDVEYYANVWSKEKVGAVSGSELSKMILESEDLGDRTYWGEELLSFEDLKAGTYYVVIMGVENGKAVDKPKKKPFMVKEKEPATLTLTREEVTSSSVGYTVTPSDPNETYIVSAILKSEFDTYETTTAFMGKDVDYWKDNGGLAAMLKKGEYSATIPGLEENTEYVLYAYYCDAEGVVTTGLVTSVFTTKTNQPTPPPAEDAPTVSPYVNMVPATKYWPDKASPTDVAFEISLNPSSNAAHTSFAFLNAEMNFPDEEVIAFLIDPEGGAYYDQDGSAIGIWQEGGAVDFAAIAIDASGNAGPLVRYKGTAEIGKSFGDPNPPTPPSGDGPSVSAEYKWVDASTIDPSYAGLWALEVKLTTDGAHTYSACFTAASSGASDSDLIAFLLAESNKDKVSIDPDGGMELWRTFEPGEQAYYAVVATDAAGKHGPLLRQEIVGGEIPGNDPNPPTPSGDYAKYLGEWTLTAKGTYTDPQTGAVTKVEDVTYNLTIEQNVAGSSYKVWGLTNYNELDVAFNAPAIWKFSNGKLQIVQSWNLGECSLDVYDRLAFFGKFKSATGDLAYFGDEGLVLAEATLASDNETLVLEWSQVTAGNVEYTCFDFIYGLGQSEGSKLTFFPGYDPAKENIVIRKAAAEQPTDAYKAYLGNWTLTSQDYKGADVTFSFTVSQKRANKSYTVTGWSGAVGTEYPFEMKFNAADGSVSLYEQGNLGTYTSSQYGTGTVFTGGMIFDPAEGEYYFWGGTEEVLTGKISGNSLTLTGKTISGTDNYGPYSYDFIGYRYGCLLADGRVLAFESSWPLFPTTVVKGGTSAKTKGIARPTATFEKAPQMKLSSVLDAANVYASFNTRMTAKVSRAKTILPVRLVSLGDSAKMPVAVLHEFVMPNYTPCRK